MLLRALIFLAALVLAGVGFGAVALPARPSDAAAGSEFAKQIESLGLVEREKAIVAEFLRGNVPGFWREFVAVEITHTAEGREMKAKVRVAPDYLAIGSDADYFLAPLSPGKAQLLADKIQCVLPTRKLVDEIHRAAPLKLEPTRIPPSKEMTTATVFARHNASVREQRAAVVAKHPLGTLVAGDKKDVVLTPRLAGAPGKVAIYGWHDPAGQAIQPLYLGHTWAWVDYSHGVRFVASQMEVDGKPTTMAAVLADPKLAPLLSDEGAFPLPRYVQREGGPKGGSAVPAASVAEVSPSEKIRTLEFAPGVRVRLVEPVNAVSAQATRLVLYALPNGNTIEHTFGRRVKEGDDWHFDIQHIGAQTRWLRAKMTEVQLVVAYLECAEKSWPAWRRKHDPEGRRIDELVRTLATRYAEPKIVLTGHSGGGSFIFGYLNANEVIPNSVERIAFLDSNYAYDAKLRHGEKLADWLAARPDHRLCVLAYHDSVALLNGKTFVSENGGTWGRSLAMQADLAKRFPFIEEKEGNWRRLTALEGRVKFFLRENPAKAILHTRQVELNGFIHSMLTGTELENAGYTYFGERVYEAWIDKE